MNYKLETMVSEIPISPKIFKALAILIGIIFLSWTFLLPIGAGPSEGDQSVYAASVIRGHVLLALHQTSFIPTWQATVPQWVGAIGQAWAQIVNQQSSGLNPNPNSYFNKSTSKSIVDFTNLAVLPPFYYAAIGLPSIVFSSLVGAFAMRIATALICLAFLWGAIKILLYSKNKKIALMGFFLALSPEVYFLSSTINTTGIEVCSSILLWSATGTICINKRDLELEIKLFKIWAIVAFFAALARTLSPLWVFISAIYIVIALGPKLIFKIIKTSRVGFYFIMPLVASLATLLWDILRGSFPYEIGVYLTNSYHTYGFFTRFLISLTRTPLFYMQAFCYVRESGFPILAAIWVALTALIVILATIKSDKSKKTILLIGMIFNIIIPAFFEALKGATLGQWWYGDYSLPLYLQSPIIAGVFLGELSNSFNKTKDNIVSLLIGLIFAAALFAQLGILYYSVVSYMFGNGKSFNIFSNSSHWTGYPSGTLPFFIGLNLISTVIILMALIKKIPNWNST
jgi:hypothetical protein